MLGGKDNFAVDREFMLRTLQGFPECVDIARQNRLFLYRAVRHLVRDAGIRQFIDLGFGLPAEDNVHQVAQRFDPEARVVYVDIDPIVLVHGRALLADNDATAVITADMREPESVVDHPDTRALIDFAEPVALLFLSTGHYLKDSDQVGRGVRHTVRHVIDEVAAPGSYLAFSQIVHDDPARGAEMSELAEGSGIPWQTRTPAEVDALLDGLEPVEPGMVNLRDWRPDPDQPPLEAVPAPLAAFVGATDEELGHYEYGGILRKP
ncbi:SAM-dependent methyltransferase [Saccharopolyspora taberi]|uniref:SAM-dependent methyltransferase n=2 Tax=Saccharopolyspora taberi TaxID=60895 RepID=A0ABN3VEC5_9PSEU